MFLHVEVPRPLDYLFIYRCPPELEDQACAGKRVIAPFGRQKITGYIIDTSVETPANHSNRISAVGIKKNCNVLDSFREVSDEVSIPPGLTTPQKEVLVKLSDWVTGGIFAVHLLH